MKSLADKRYLVVGASRGIGRAVASKLLADGADVLVWCRTAPQQFDEGTVSFQAVDVLEPIAAQDVELPQSIDGLVYAPGSIDLGAFRQMSMEVFRKSYEINVLGAVNVLQATIGALTQGDGGAVVLFSTVAASVGMQFHTAISSSKAALHGLSMSMAAEYATSNVRFNVIAPSLTDTPLAARLLSNDQKRANAASRHPLSRIGKPEDCASAVRFLLDPSNSWITGQVLGIDGGLGSLSGL